MSTNTPTKARANFPSIFDDFFKPWNEWFNGNELQRQLTVPAVNISEEKDGFKITMAAPGLKKEDIHVDIDGNLMTISASTEQENEETDKKYTRKEYNYSSFSRTFTLPDEVNKDNINARYENGILHLTLPRQEQKEKGNSKKIVVS